MPESKPVGTRKLAVAVNYFSLALLPFVIKLGRVLGWQPALAAVLGVLLSALLVSLYLGLVRPGFWRLAYRGAASASAGSASGAWVWRTGYAWFAAVALIAVYLKTQVILERLSLADLAALVYLAATLPAALIAWRGAGWAPHPGIWQTWLRRCGLVLAVLLVLLVINLVLIRPWQHHWGATRAEIARAMPGDELVANPDLNATRAVTIATTPEEIWPWLVQLGYQRGGFYSIDFLDNGGEPSAETILPEFQQLQVGDQIPLGGGAYMVVAALEPGQALVLEFGEGPWQGNSWTFGLYPAGDGKARLVSRLRAKYDWGFPDIGPWLMIDTFEIIMMRQCLLGIKRRAEQSSAP